MVMTLIVIVIGLAGLCLFLIKRIRDIKARHSDKLKRVKREKLMAIEEMQVQTSVTLEENEIKFLQEKNKELTEAEREQEEQRLHFEEILSRKNKYINQLQRYKRDKGEMLTHQFLSSIKEELIQAGMDYDDMIVMGNVFIPHTTQHMKETVNSRQIDHLVLMRTGIFVIETKYWAGDVLHGLSKRSAKEFSFLLDKMFRELKETDERTLVVKGATDSRNQSNSEKEKSLVITKYGDGNPDKQVNTTSYSLFHFLKNEGMNCKWVHGILYFGYPQDENNRVVSFGSSYALDRKPFIITSQDDLKKYFEQQEKKEKVYSKSELREIKELLLRMNEIS